MCGIFGFIGKNHPNKTNINFASKLLRHRGPDAEGIYEKKFQKKSVLLGHRRLSIIDLKKRSNQPFYFSNSFLIFNGEIYNFEFIRKELISLGHKFITKSDTEVLSHALREWNMNALKKIEGMWSFAWFDDLKKKLYLSRDRFGEKPLYLYKNTDNFYFSSEINSLIKLSNISPSINLKHLSNFMVNGYKSLYKKRSTFFNSISEVEKGSFFEIDLKNNIKKKYYWQKKIPQNLNLKYEDCVDITKNLLIKSVGKQLKSDVPLAFCMSGGVDSNCLISIAKKIFNYDVHGFTINNPDKRYRENNLIDKSINNLKIKHTYVDLDKSNFLLNLKKNIIHNNSPIYTLAHYLHYQLTKEMHKQGYKVSISGIGADELFTGYYDHHLFYLKQIKSNKILFNQSLKNWKKEIFKIVRNPFLKDPKNFLENKNYGRHIYLNSHKFKKYFFSTNDIEKFSHKKIFKDILRNRMYNEIFYETIPVMLHEEDMNSMQFSIENRSPFLDKNLFEFAYSIPTEFLIRKAYAKSVLRDSMRNIVDQNVLSSVKKVGFNTSILDLINLNDKEVIAYILDDTKIFEIVKKEKIEKLLKSKHLLNSYSKFLFNFINAKIFLETRA